MTTTEFIPYEQALALKELGFSGECFGYYNADRFVLQLETISSQPLYNKEYCLAPLYQQAFKFFREKYSPEELNFYINLLDTSKIPKKYLPCYTIRKGINVIEIATRDTYEEAEQECLKKLIEIVQKIKN